MGRQRIAVMVALLVAILALSSIGARPPARLRSLMRDEARLGGNRHSNAADPGTHHRRRVHRDHGRVMRRERRVGCARDSERRSGVGSCRTNAPLARAI